MINEMELTIVLKNMKRDDAITGLSNFDESPRQQLSAAGVELHPHHHRSAAGALFAAGNHHLRQWKQCNLCLRHRQQYEKAWKEGI